MFLYEFYCYATLANVGDLILGAPLLPNGWIVSSVAYPNSTDITVTTISNGSFTIVPPSCDMLGFASSYTGLTIADSVELSWLIIGMLITAYTVSVIRRCL